MTLLRQRPFDAPAALKPAVDRIVSHANNLRPVNDAQGLPVVGQKMSSTSILLLLASWNPPAVVRRIRTVIVDSFNRVVGARLPAHIGQEVFKRQPSLANDNSSPAIAMEACGFRVAASREHAAPSAVFGRPVASLSHSMGPVGFSEEFFSEATATIDISPTKSAGGDLLDCATVAFALPLSDASWIRDISQNGKSPKPLASKVYKARTLRRIILFSHNFLLIRNSGQRRRSVTSASSPRLLRGTSIIANRRMEAT